MKLVLQIAGGIFLGLMTTAIVINGYLNYQFNLAATDIAAELQRTTTKQRETAIQREMRELERVDQQRTTAIQQAERQNQEALQRLEAEKARCKVTAPNGRVLNCGHIPDGITSP